MQPEPKGVEFIVNSEEEMRKVTAAIFAADPNAKVTIEPAEQHPFFSHEATHIEDILRLAILRHHTNPAHLRVGNTFRAILKDLDEAGYEIKPKPISR